jgi:phage baseplate assembly protein W
MEISQDFGNDLKLNSVGDITQSENDDLSKQSIIRRLLTNPGEYIWHPTYGAGIGRFVGENLSSDNFDVIKNTIISQMLMEETVAQSPLPIITLQAQNGTVLICDITYYDAVLKNPKTISFKVA